LTVKFLKVFKGLLYKSQQKKLTGIFIPLVY
jgi:hypothetical protein